MAVGWRLIAASSAAGTAGNRSLSSDQASSTLPPDPASSGSNSPTGTLSRSPEPESRAATHSRRSPDRTYS